VQPLNKWLICDIVCWYCYMHFCLLTHWLLTCSGMWCTASFHHEPHGQEWCGNMTQRFLGTFAYSWKVSVSFIMSVCLSTCITLAPTRWISVKFDVCKFHKNLWIKSIFGCNQTKVLGALFKDLSTYDCCQWC